MPAPAAPAKKTIAPKIPSMSKLTGDAGAAPPAENQPPAEGDKPPGGNEPPPGNNQPDPNAPALPEIPTRILGAEKPQPPKNQQAIIEERRKAKEAREQAGAVTNENDDFRVQLATTQAERDRLKAERDQFEQKQKDFEALANKRAEELEEVRKGYFTQHQPTVDPTQDETFVSAHQTMVERLTSHLPAKIKTAAGEARVFPSHLLNDPAKMNGLHNILAQYNKAVAAGSEEGIDHSVQAMAMWLGADVDVTSANKADWKLLEKGDPALEKIEEALRAAAPQYQIKAERYTHIAQSAPVLAKQQYEKKIGGLREALKGQVFMSQDAAVTALRADPNDSQALFSLIVQAAPELKDHVEATLGGYAETFATVSDQLRLPTLASNDPAAIQQHRTVLAQHQQRLSRAMRNAVIGECIGPILTSLIAERDAAEARAAAAAEATNPGSAGSRGGAGGSSTPEIPTSIIGAGGAK